MYSKKSPQFLKKIYLLNPRTRLRIRQSQSCDKIISYDQDIRIKYKFFQPHAELHVYVYINHHVNGNNYTGGTKREAWRLRTLFFSSPKHQQRLCGPPSLRTMATGFSSPRSTAAGVCSWPLASVQCGGKVDRDNFTLCIFTLKAVLRVFFSPFYTADIQSALWYDRSSTTVYCTCMVFDFCSFFGDPSDRESIDCSSFNLTRKSGPAHPRTQSSFQPLCVPISIPVTLPV